MDTHIVPESFVEQPPTTLANGGGPTIQTFLDDLTALTRRAGLIIMGPFALDPYDPAHDLNGSYLIDPGGRVEWVA